MFKAIVLVLLVNSFSFFLLGNNIANAATFNVGDDGGWTFGVSSWPNNKTFHTGDILVFKYPVGRHSVVVVNETNFNSCTASGTTFTSGNDQITLKAGTSHFICGFPGHCANQGMKIAVTANLTSV